jgi:hypothetical protein
MAFASTGRPQAWPCALLLALAGCGGCGAPKEAAPSSRQPGPRTADAVRPVYEATGSVDVRAARLCNALHALPEEHRAACCGAQPGVELARPCATALSAAFNSQALAVEPARLEACTAALESAYQGCDWVGVFGPPVPRECKGLFTGRRQAGESCRSSLECEGTLLCEGLGPTDVGRCASPPARGANCNLAVDALATYTKQDAERLHPPCQGICTRHRCEAAVADGAACSTSQVCAPGHHCADGHCAQGPAAAGERCWGGDCATGLRCMKGTCRAPLPEGTACINDFECLGGCTGAAGSRHCAMRCDVR